MKTAGYIIVLLIFAACNTPDVVSPKKTLDIDAEIQSEMKAHSIPSVVACVIKNDNIVWHKAYGYANIENNIPVTPTTTYTMMSVSKLVLITAAMQLWEQNRLKLDDDVNFYLPFSIRHPRYPHDKITVRMLMTHTAGFSHPDNKVTDWYKFYPDDETPLMATWMDQWLLPVGTFYDPDIWKKWPPGSREEYSNIGTCLLAFIVEQVSGQEYTEYCDEHILQPLDMHHSSFWLKNIDIQKQATPYLQGLRPIENYNSIAYPVGWLKSSAVDFSHFLIAYLNGGVYNEKRILAESTIERILHIQNPASGRCLIWSHLWGEWYGHDGGGTGFASQVDINPEQKLGVILLSNLYTDKIYPGSRIYSLVRLKVKQFE